MNPLLSDDESLETRIAADAEQLRELGVTTSELGSALSALLRRGEESDWFSPATRGSFEVEVRKRRGILTCPWAPEEYASCGHGDGGKRAGANEFFVRNLTTGASLTGFVLSAHLIAEHAFFGGNGTRFRIQPKQLAALFARNA